MPLKSIGSILPASSCRTSFRQDQQDLRDDNGLLMRENAQRHYPTDERVPGLPPA